MMKLFSDFWLIWRVMKSHAIDDAILCWIENQTRYWVIMTNVPFDFPIKIKMIPINVTKVKLSINEETIVTKNDQF